MSDDEWRNAVLQGPYEHIDLRKLRRRNPEPDREEQPKQTLDVPLKPRFEGAWAVGLPGTGKTQLFQYLISRDLDMVAAGKASIVVLDPTGDEPGTLIHNLTRLKRFAPGGDLHGRLVYIDPTDRSFTVPINLLAIKSDREDEAAISSAISSYVSIMGGLMGQPLTDYQDPPFRYAVQVALAFDRPTLDTLRRIIAVPSDRDGSSYWREVQHQLDPTVRAYMETSFDNATVRRSRGEIMNRLYSLSSDPIFRRLFESEETKIDFDEVINTPTVCVINASRDHLRSLKELYGRYFLSMLKAAGERRPASSFPCFIYIDECSEFCAYDSNVQEVIFRLRRKRVALTLGSQEVKHIVTPRGAFLGTAIKFVNCDIDSARELAPMMGLGGEHARDKLSTLIDRPPLNFAYYIRGRMPEGPQSFVFKPGTMEAMPRMSDAEWNDIRDEIRERYYIPTTRSSKPPIPPAPEYAVEVSPEPQPAPVSPSPPPQQSPETPPMQTPKRRTPRKNPYLPETP